MTLTQFADTFNSKPDDPKMTQFYKRFKKQNGVADVLEIFAGFVSPTISLINTYFNNPNNNNNIYIMVHQQMQTSRIKSNFYLVFLILLPKVMSRKMRPPWQCTLNVHHLILRVGSFVKLGLIVMPTDDELEFCSGWLFTKEDGTGTKEYVSLEEFRAWADTEPASLELLETLNCVPIVESIIEYIENKTKEVHDQFEQFSSIKDNKEKRKRR